MLGEGTLKQLFIGLALAMLCVVPVIYSQSAAEPTFEPTVEPAVEPTAEPTADSAVRPQAERIDESTLLFDEGEVDPAAGGFTTAPTFGVADFVRMVLVLAAVVAAIYGVFYLLKKASIGTVADSDVIRPLGSRTLPGNKSLHLVEIGNQVFLVGAADHSVNLIAEITDKESIDQLVLQSATTATNRRKSFSELLSGVLGGNRGEPEPSMGNPFQFMHQQKERLKKLR